MSKLVPSPARTRGAPRRHSLLASRDPGHARRLRRTEPHRRRSGWRRWWRGLPSLIRLVIVNGALGAALGAGLAAALIATNAAGLRTLIFQSADPVTPTAMLVLSMASLMAAVVIGAAAMAPPADD